LRVAVIAVLFLVAMAGAVSGQVRGRVVEVRTGIGVSGATVHVQGGGADREVVSGADGSYAFLGLASAEYSLRVRHPGYETANVRLLIAATRELVVDVPLELRPIPLSPLLIPVSRTAAAGPPGPSAADSLTALLADERAGSLRARTTAPLADLAAAKVRDQAPDPGGQHPDALHIWGSSTDRGRVFLDGAAINAPLHLGGLLPPLDPGLLAQAALRTGGASARYDGGTSYIMDFRTRSPDADRLGGWGEVGLLATRLGVEAPIGARGSILAGARRINQEVLDGLIQGPFDYEFGDALARGEVGVGGHTASVLVLATREAVRVPRDFGYDEAAWRNLATVVAWQPEAGGEGLRLHASFSRGIADLPLLSAPDGHLEARLDRTAVAATNDWTVGDLGLDAGFEVEQLSLARRSEAAADPALPTVGERVACTVSLPCASATSTTLAGFGEVAAQLGRSFAFRAGLRAALEKEDGRARLLPRVALTWAGAQARSAATLSLGRYSQVAFTEARGDLLPQPRGLRIATETATQLELRVTHATSTLALEGSAYLRRDEAGGARVAGSVTPGAELSWVLLAHGNSLSGGYSILGRRSFLADSAYGPQHLAFLGARTGRGPLQLDLSAVYGDGMPLTSIVLDGGPTTETLGQPATEDAGDVEPSGAYVRFDAAISGTWMLRMRGRAVQVSPYARLVNAFGRDGAPFYYQAGGRAELQPLSALPTMPVVGVRWVF
jgi:Carboxypeptidase regulatory-like domain